MSSSTLVLWLVAACVFNIGCNAGESQCNDSTREYMEHLNAVNEQLQDPFECPTTMHPFQELWCTGSTAGDASSVVNNFCSTVKSAGRVGTAYKQRCPASPLNSAIPYPPDVYLAVAKLCEIGDPVKYIKTMAPCIRKLNRLRLSKGMTGIMSTPPPGGWVADARSPEDIEGTVSRKGLCRLMQAIVAFGNDAPGNLIVEACGQEDLDTIKEFRDKSLLALDCAEFGDYIRTFDWMNIRYESGVMTD